MTAHNDRIRQAEIFAGVYEDEDNCPDCRTNPCSCDDLYQFWKEDN